MRWRRVAKLSRIGCTTVITQEIPINDIRNGPLAAHRGRVLYWGRPFDLDPHRNAVSVFCVVPDGLMTVLGGDVSRNRPRSCRTVYVPAGTLHQMDVAASCIVCLYLDPLGDDAAAVQSDMTCTRDGVSTAHAREQELIDVLATPRPDKIGELMHTLEKHLELPATRLVDRRIEHAVDRLLRDPGSSVSLAMLANEAGLSSERFRHAFKEGTGLPFTRFRIWARMGAAISIAHNGGSLTEAAHGAGFSTSAHFSRCFRAMFGLTPSRFMAQQRATPIAPV